MLVKILVLAILLRVVLLFYGLFQDAYGALPYTDIDYYVFTDAARYVYFGSSPYERETYRYTPLLAWILTPTAFPNPIWFSFGKILFAAADIITGWLIYILLHSAAGGKMGKARALKFASIWLLNPMVATISTRGSSEGLLGVIVIGLLWAVLAGRFGLAGVLLGLAVHFKIYPFIYGVSILLHTDSWTHRLSPSGVVQYMKAFITRNRVVFLASSLVTFTALNCLMYSIYGYPFLQHTFFHHLTRVDHRHNFSPYNTLLHLSSHVGGHSSLRPESLAFLPQLALSAVLLPLTLTSRSLPATMLAQTFAFVSFNKVCTSQYFLWYLVLLPFYLPYSSLLARPKLGLTVAGAWIAAQGLWLWHGWRLEFLGESSFLSGLPGRGLWGASLLFFGVNCWILGIIIRDVGNMGREAIIQDDPAIIGKGGRTYLQNDSASRRKGN